MINPFYKLNTSLLKSIRFYSYKRFVKPEPLWSVNSLLKEVNKETLSGEYLQHLGNLSALNASSVKSLKEDINRLNHLFDILNEIKIEGVESTERLTDTQVIDEIQERKAKSEEIGKKGYYVI